MRGLTQRRLRRAGYVPTAPVPTSAAFALRPGCSLSEHVGKRSPKRTFWTLSRRYVHFAPTLSDPTHCRLGCTWQHMVLSKRTADKPAQLALEQPSGSNRTLAIIRPRESC